MIRVIAKTDISTINQAIQQTTDDYVLIAEETALLDIEALGYLYTRIKQEHIDIAFCDFYGAKDGEPSVLIHPNINHSPVSNLRREVLLGNYPDTLSNVIISLKAIRQTEAMFQETGCFANRLFLGTLLMGEVSIGYFRKPVCTMPIPLDYGRSGQLSEDQYKALPLLYDNLKTTLPKDQFEDIFYIYKSIALAQKYLSLTDFCSWLPLSYSYMTSKKFRTLTRARNAVAYTFNKFGVKMVRMGVM